MERLLYEKLVHSDDIDIPAICAEMDKPCVSRFISYDKNNYWLYVTTTRNVFFYKVYYADVFIGTMHLETAGSVLYMDILVFERHRRKGFGKRIISDILSGVLPISYDRIDVSIDKENIASIGLFEKNGFVFDSADGELLNYTYVEQ